MLLSLRLVNYLRCPLCRLLQFLPGCCDVAQRDHQPEFPAQSETIYQQASALALESSATHAFFVPSKNLTHLEFTLPLQKKDQRGCNTDQDLSLEKNNILLVWLPMMVAKYGHPFLAVLLSYNLHSL